MSNLEKTNASKSDMDKFKLLISENEMIINLIVKQCHKLATLENKISLNKFTTVISKQSTAGSYSNIADIENELSQTQRKKEEASYLKHGIRKRELIVRDFLKKYNLFYYLSISKLIYF